MKVTIVYDNEVCRDDLKADWGFSALVEFEGKKILFDTGASGSILQHNMERLGIDPEAIDDVFISHSHFDHTGGLVFLLYSNNRLKLWVPYIFPEIRGVKTIRVKDPVKLYNGVYSTGVIDNIEHSLCITTSKGVVIIAGCSHPKLSHILNKASLFGDVFGIIGGMHSNSPDQLKGLKLICPTHCTQYVNKIKKLYPENYIEGGAGRVIEI